MNEGRAGGRARGWAGGRAGTFGAFIDELGK